MIKEDVSQVFDTKRRGPSDSSWTIDTFYHEVERSNFTKYFVLEFEQQITGYLGLRIVIDQAQITTIAIDDNYRECDLGQMLLKYGINYTSHTCGVMSLEVRVNNEVAQHVCENLRFQYDGERKDYYGRGEGAMVM